jgi:hypothetical protein
VLRDITNRKDLMFNAIDSAALEWHRGVYRTGGGTRRSMRTVTSHNDLTVILDNNKFDDDFVCPFELPDTPEIPEWVDFRGGPGPGGGGGGPVARPPVYTSPAFSIGVSPTTAQEVGTVTPIQITPAWTQRHAGNPTNYRITISGTEVWSNSSPSTPTNINAASNIDSVRTHNLTWSDTTQQIRSWIAHEEGPVLNNNLGEPDPTGRIPANSNLGSSNTVSLTGFRVGFFQAFATNITVPTDSNGIRLLLAGRVNNIVSARRIVIPATTSTWDLIFAYPASMGNVIDFRPPGSPIDQSAALTRTTVLVGGVNNFDPVPYNVFHLHAFEPLITSGNFTIDIV